MSPRRRALLDRLPAPDGRGGEVIAYREDGRGSPAREAAAEAIHRGLCVRCRQPIGLGVPFVAATPADGGPEAYAHRACLLGRRPG